MGEAVRVSGKVEISKVSLSLLSTNYYYTTTTDNSIREEEDQEPFLASP